MIFLLEVCHRRRKNAIKEAKDAVKKNILAMLKDKYGIEEEDFLSAELEAVPAGPCKRLWNRQKYDNGLWTR